MSTTHVRYIDGSQFIPIYTCLKTALGLHGPPYPLLYAVSQSFYLGTRVDVERFPDQSTDPYPNK